MAYSIVYIMRGKLFCRFIGGVKITAPGEPAGRKPTVQPGASTLPLQSKGAGRFILA